MLNSKQRAALRGEANSYEVVLTVGKSGIAEQVVAQADGALRTREMIKCKALETCPLTARAAAEQLAEATGADVVQVIGRVFILYRQNKEEPVVSEKLFGIKKPTVKKLPSVRREVKSKDQKETARPLPFKKSGVRFGKGSVKKDENRNVRRYL